jgi:uncharacterized protein YecT (DUF1311 family)
MRIARTAAWFLFLPAGLLFAQTPKCDEARTNLDMRQCLTGELQVADSQLGALLKAIHPKVSDSAARTLEAASSKWVAYRKAECEAVLRSYEGGKEGPVAQLACSVSLTNDRLAHLKRTYAGSLQ